MDTGPVKAVHRKILCLCSQMETMYLTVHKVILLTQAVCMWEKFKKKDGDIAKENIFHLNRENLVM